MGMAEKLRACFDRTFIYLHGGVPKKIVLELEAMYATYQRLTGFRHVRPDELRIMVSRDIARMIDTGIKKRLR